MPNSFKNPPNLISNFVKNYINPQKLPKWQTINQYHHSRKCTFYEQGRRNEMSNSIEILFRFTLNIEQFQAMIITATIKSVMGVLFHAGSTILS